MAELQSSTINGNKVWTAGNDGADSGLDADTLNGRNRDEHERLRSSRSFGLPQDSASGWYTIAVNSGDRAGGRFGIRGTRSGDHQAVSFYATHHFGRGNQITILANGNYSGNEFTDIRLLEGGTYEGCLVQVRINGGNRLTVYELGDNGHTSGWILVDWVPEDTDPAPFAGITDSRYNFSSLTTVAAQISVVDYGDDGFFGTTNDLVAGTLSKGSGSFEIPHPDPNKPEYKLRHSFVESPTRGENLYRYAVEVGDTLEKSIFLPDYWTHLNENPQFWVYPVDNFGQAYAEISNNNRLKITVNTPGTYNIVGLATRKDKIAVDYWDKLGVEYKESDVK